MTYAVASSPRPLEAFGKRSLPADGVARLPPRSRLFRITSAKRYSSAG